MPKYRRKEPDYDIGYGKPPKSGQFKPGQSGNPKGRPRHSPDIDATIVKLFQQKRTVVVNGKKVRMTGEELIAHSQFNLALKGDAKARDFVITAVIRHAHAEKKRIEQIIPATYTREYLSSLAPDELAKLYQQTILAQREWEKDEK